MLKKLYENYLLKYPKAVLFLISIFIVIVSVFAFRLEIDASAETLLLEDDKDLEFTREVSKRFTTENFLVITYTTEDDLLSDKNIENIEELSSQIIELELVESITSIVNVPLLQSPPMPLKELIKDVPTLKTKSIDRSLAKQEFLNSPIYKENLVSNDFKTTAIMINLKRDEKYFTLIADRDSYVKLKKQRDLSENEKISFKEASLKLKKYRDIVREKSHKNIVKIKEIIEDFQLKNKNIELHLGGVDMIADDMVEFVKYDLKTFGYMILLLLIVILYLLLREKRWVFISLLICSISLAITSGLLGLFGWEITVVSSNFISLQLIMNMSLVVHLVVKYKELHSIHPNETQKNLAISTVTSMAKPSFFVVITTIAGFSSLVFSNILPIINFGWMMSIGIVVSLLVTFILFPLMIIYFNKSDSSDTKKDDVPFSTKMAYIANNNKTAVLIITLLVVVFSATGAFKLRVENSFIDYFKRDTYIYQGMAVIDKKLGGTTPLDVILTFKDDSDEIDSINVASDEEFDELDEFNDEFEESPEEKEQYWFTSVKMQKIKEVHQYLESQKEIGKVLSLATMGEVLKTLNDGKEADSFTLALLYKELPLKFRKVILSPYINIEANQVRISTRIIDSMPKLQRDKLLKRIDRDLKKIIDPKSQEFRLSNILVMYNNMLQSLFKSQIDTIGVVVFILFIMFLVLFRNLKVALIAIVVNTIPVSVIFGFMGWLNIPLDMMTITIAAISIGIAVDNTIHYIHRFSLEYKSSQDRKKSMFNAHGSIGRAMFYTSTIIMIGFSILVFSNFIPTIYFGLLTMVAMFMAIVSDLILLPVLLLIFGV